MQWEREEVGYQRWQEGEKRWKRRDSEGQKFLWTERKRRWYFEREREVVVPRV
jgi:hypothetical protein